MTYDFDGDKYSIASSHQREWGGKVITELSLNGNERILDLGCGVGALTAQLADLVPHGFVLGIDSSPSMIEAAKKHKKSNLSFSIKDINSLDFFDEFDLVFSNAALHWVKNHDRLLRNVYACLKNHGIIRFDFAAEGNCSFLIKIMHEAIRIHKYAKYFSNFEWPWYMPKVKEYEEFMQRYPFHDIKVWGGNADRFFPNADALIKWIDQPSCSFS